ncbi:hypothetical protein ICN82_00975 [Mangrovicoccus sp. HB182678]|uniref:Lipoprotein n=2 Tax=Mangrovicoccus algicola TaxID=2771008 RepID=A0A8J6YVY0_9RHOB|nr:hypothetical protein [Mangrovicoccus algicola]
MRHCLLPVLLLTGLAGCDPAAFNMGGATADPVPEAVRAMAAPGQNVDTARVLEDNCYWYDHAGPVETTPLPLLTAEGRPICRAAPDAATEAEAPAA